MPRKRAAKPPTTGDFEGATSGGGGGWAHRVLPLILVTALLLLGVAAGYLLGTRTTRQENARSSTVPLSPGEPAVDAAAVLRLPRELPQSVEEFNQEALTVGRLLVETLPERPEAHVQMAFAHLQLGQERAALQSWQAALARDENLSDAHLGIGVILEEQGENEQAIASYRKAIELNPELEHAYRELAEVLLRVGRAEEALSVARECVRRFPTGCENHFWLGQAHLELGNYEQAYRSHKGAVRLDPDFPLSYFPLARACTRLGKHDEAAHYREQFATLRPAELQADRDRTRAYDDVVTHRHRLVKRHALAGTLHLQVGDLRLAEAHWLRAAAIGPDDVATRKALALLYQNQQRAGAEVEFLSQLSRLEPYRPEHPLRKARLLIEMEAWSEAEETLSGLIQAQPELPDAHLLLAEMHFRTGLRDSAAAHAEKALSLRASAQGFLLLAAICQEGDDRAGALQAMKQALSLDPENPQIRQTYEQLLATN